MKALEIRDLRFSYKKKYVLKDLNLEVPHPSIVAVIGPNGSGKSTLAKIVIGQLKGEGEVRIFGKLVLGKGRYVPPSNREVAYVPQRTPVFPHLTVKENLEFASRNAPSNLLNEAIELFELEPILGLRGRELSGGQAKRVSMAMAFVSGRKLIVMDEPLSGIDPSSREKLIGVVRHLVETWKTSILWITHFEEVVRESDDVYEMKNGSLRKMGEK